MAEIEGKAVYPKPSLGFADSLSLMVGIVIGVGIFEATPAIAAQLPSLAAVAGVWILGGLLSLAGALCYAELAAANPKDGGDYVYLNRAFGSWLGFFFAWGRVAVVQPGTIAAVAFPFAHFAIKTVELVFARHIGEHAVAPVAAGGVLVLTLLNCLGVQVGMRVQNSFTVLKTVGLIVIAAVVLLASPTSTPVPTMEFSLRGFGLALILVMFTFGGWSDIAFVAAEVRDSVRCIPRAIAIAVVSVAAIYLFANFAFFWALGHGGVAQSQAVAVDALSRVLPGLAQAAVAALIAVSALGAINALIFTGARIGYVLGCDFVVFRPLSRWSQADGGPVISLLFSGISSVCIIMLMGSFERIVVYTAPVVWLFYFLSMLALMVLRLKTAEAERPFSVPFYPVLPICFAVACLYIAYAAIDYDFTGSAISLGILMLGLPLYFFEALKSWNRP